MDDKWRRFIRDSASGTRRLQVIGIEEVLKWHHDMFTPEHLLLGLLRIEDAGVVQMLNASRIEPKMLEQALVQQMCKGTSEHPLPTRVTEAPQKGPDIPISPEVLAIYNRAMEIADGEEAVQVEPKHVLSAVLSSTYKSVKKAIEAAQGGDSKVSR